MTSREIVSRALDFSPLPRIPRQLWLLPWASNHYPEVLARIQKRFPDDILLVPLFYKEPPRRSGKHLP